jgi:CheY-like chemotaxis protein
MRNRDIQILIAEDDEGHAALIRKNLKRSGIINPIVRFKDGQEILDFLFDKEQYNESVIDKRFVILLDIRMPKVDGIEVLARLKGDRVLKKIPVIMLTTTDDPADITRCHDLGCSCYITKPVKYEKFMEAVTNLGLFLKIIELPEVSGE